MNKLQKKVDYKLLIPSQQEIYNFQKVSAVFADYGYTTIKLSDDWLGADFIAISFDGNVHLKVQLKGRLTFDKKYVGKDIDVCFQDHESSKWFLYPHDELLEEIEPEIAGTESWKSGTYHFPILSEKNRLRLQQYAIT